MKRSDAGGRSPAAIVVRQKSGQPTRAIVSLGGMIFEAAIGRSGISAFKREGDGATPLASMRLIEGFYRADRLARPVSRLQLTPIRDGIGWCDAPAHAAYNRRVRLPFPASHETLKRGDGLYDIVLVMDWNITSRRRGKGSAIFFHLARPGYLPTEGCVAVSRRDMLRLLTAARRGTIVRVAR